MEHNEQLPENTAESIENEGNTAAEVSAVTVAENTPGDNKESAEDKEESQAVTNPQATIKIEGQEFELEAALAQDDKMLKTILQPLYSSIENANITREIKDGKLIVTIVKRAQHKGA